MTMDDSNPRRRTSAEIASSLRQTESPSQRRRAIHALGKTIRRPNLFSPTWDAVGGADGLAQLMAEFSVNDVRVICRRLSGTAGAQGDVAERRAALAELVKLLLDDTYDARPLQKYYKEIVIACEFHVLEFYEENMDCRWRLAQQKRIVAAHQPECRRKFLPQPLSAGSPPCCLIPHDDLGWSEQKLSGVLGEIQKSPLTVEWHAIEPDFATPLLKRLFRRHDTAETMRILDLIVQCAETSREDRFNKVAPLGPLVQILMKQWRQDDSRIDPYLIRVLKARRPSQYPPDLWSIANFICRLKGRRDRQHHPGRCNYDPYPLLRLFLLHHPGLDVDIDDEEALKKREKVLAPWYKPFPMELFTSTKPTTALGLVERLSKAFPKIFPVKSKEAGKTILSGQEYAQGQIYKTWFIRLVWGKVDGQGDSTWLDKVHRTIDDLKERASDPGTSPWEQAPRAAAAINLCVAAGDLARLEALVIWARRFIVTKLACRRLYSCHGIITTELEELLCCIPRHVAAGSDITPASISADIEIANRIALELVRTVKAAETEPDFLLDDWMDVLRLPYILRDRRLERASSLKAAMPPDWDAVEAIWKPTAAAMIEIDIARPRSCDDALGSLVFQPDQLMQLPVPARANLASFMLDIVTTRLEPGILPPCFSHVVAEARSIANSDQPALACPLIRNIIRADRGQRTKLVTPGFLSTLPPKTAREFLFDMVVPAAAEAVQKNASQSRQANEPSVTESQNAEPAMVTLVTNTLSTNHYLDAATTLEVLVSLADRFKDMDSSISILDGLVLMVRRPDYRWTSPPPPPLLRQRIRQTLEDFAVPIAARLNEQSPGGDGECLDIGWETRFTDRLIYHADSPARPGDGQKDIYRLVMKILEESSKTHRRWLCAFLAEHGFSPNEVGLPALPVHPRVLMEAMGYYLLPHITPAVFEMARSFFLVNLDPPPNIQRVTNFVVTNTELAASNAGQHWLSVFHADKSLWSDGFEKLLKRMAVSNCQWRNVEPFSNDPPFSVPPERLAAFAVEAAERCLRRPDAAKIVDSIMHHLGNWAHDESHREWWRTRIVPILRQIISLVDAFVSTADGPTASLNTIKLRKSLVLYPRQGEGKEVKDAFVHEFSALVRYLTDQTPPRHDELEKLRDRPISEVSLCRLAMAVVAGDDIVGDNKPSPQAYQRLRVAAGLLKDESEDPGEKITEEVRTLVQAWKTCKAEEVRVMAQEVEKELLSRPWYSDRYE